MAELLTKEEKDKLVEQRMADMKKKNEAILKRRAEIEAEKQALGDAAAPPRSVTDKDWKSPEYKDDWEGRHNDEERSSHNYGSVWPGQNPEERQESSSWDESNRQTPQNRRGSRGRGAYRGVQRGRSAYQPSQSPQNNQQPQFQAPQAEEDWGADTSSSAPSVPSPQPPEGRGGFQSTPPRGHHRGGRGAQAGSGRLSQNTQNRHPHRQEQSYDEIRKQNALAYEQEMNSQSSGGRGFLSDNFRDSHHSALHGGEGRTNRDMRGEGQDNSRGGGGGPPHRHFRNYGGGDQPVDLRDKIKKERQHGQHYGGGGGETNPDLSMTGRQRAEHTRWKQQQEKFDQERKERAKNSQGDWKREWDSDKPAVNQAGGNLPPQMNIYKQMDDKKITKKVGSGRFVIDSNTAAATSPTKKSSSKSGPGAGMRGVGGGIKGSVPGTGRGRGRGKKAASNKPSQDGATAESKPGVEDSRKVMQTDNELRVTINPGSTPSAGTTGTRPQKGQSVSPRNQDVQHSPNKHHPQSATQRQNSRDNKTSPNKGYQNQSRPYTGSNKRYEGEGSRSSGRGGRGEGGQGRGGGRSGRRHSDNYKGDQYENQGGFTSPHKQPQSSANITTKQTHQAAEEKIQSETNTSEQRATSPAKQQTAPSSNPVSNTKQPSNSSSNANNRPTAYTSGYYYQMSTYPKIKNAKSEVIGVDGGEEEDEEGWEDCESDEDFYSTEKTGKQTADVEDDDVTPRASKEPTPAPSDKTVSKEGTPVPQGTEAKSVSSTDNKTSAEIQDEEGEEEIIVISDSPPKAELHIDIRDPVNEEDDVEDVLKTPEGGRVHIDWAAEMED